MFVFSDIDLVIHDLVDGNCRYIDDYLRIYRELFPQYVRYIPVMRRRAEVRADTSEYEKWHQWLLVVSGKPVGIIGFLYNRRRNVGLLMDFAIYPEARAIQAEDGIPFSKFILGLSMQQLVADARENEYLAPICMAAEVEYPALLKKYQEYGYVKFSVDYFEPPYTPELQKVGDKIENLNDMDYGKMYVGAFQIPDHPFDKDDPGVIKTVLSAFLIDHYKLSPNHWLVQQNNL